MTLKAVSLSLTAAVAVIFLAMGAPAQQSPKNSTPSPRPAQHDESWVRDINPNAPCKFAPIYERISENKKDPRVAFVELSKFVHAENPLTFQDLCQMISDQTEDTHAVFDKSGGFLQILWGGTDMTEALAYFAGIAGKPGVFLFMKSDGFRPFVFAYRDQEWHDVTKQYLGPLNLGQKDYIVVPQYGRTARVLAYDEATRAFTHKMWLRWDGVKFEPGSVRPKDWRCPDTYQRYFIPQARRQYCQ